MTLNDWIKKIEVNAVDVEIEREIIKKEIDMLEKVGWPGQFDNWPIPTINMRDGRYMRLIYVSGSERWEKYIGADPIKQNYFVQAVCRQKRVYELRQRLDEIDKVLNCAHPAFYAVASLVAQR
jgi:hypothetical protein